MILCSASRHTRPVPAVCIVEVRGRRVPVCGACARALADRGVQGIVHPLPEPEPAMTDAFQAVTDTIIAYADAVESAPPVARPAPNRHLPLILRPNADAHPELCRVDECTGKVKARGVCDQHLTALGRAGDTAILLPRADRSEAARKAAAVRSGVKRKPVAPTPVVEQPGPAIPVEDGDGVAPPPVAPRVLERIGPDYYANTDGPTVSVWRSIGMSGTWCALDTAEPGLTRHPTPEAAAAHLGARLPDSVCSKMEPTAPVTTPILPGVGKPEHVLSATEAEKEWAGPPIPYDDDLARRILEWRGRDAVPTETVTIPAAVLARMIYATDPTPREQELQAQVEEQAGQIRRLEARIKGADATNDAMARSLSDIDAILDTTGAAPGQTTTERVRALASRTAPPPDQRLQAIAAELLADLDDVTDAGEAWGIHLVRALRLAVGVES